MGYIVLYNLFISLPVLSMETNILSFIIQSIERHLGYILTIHCKHSDVSIFGNETKIILCFRKNKNRGYISINIHKCYTYTYENIHYNLLFIKWYYITSKQSRLEMLTVTIFWIFGFVSWLEFHRMKLVCHKLA